MDFEEKVETSKGAGLWSIQIETMQFNLGLRCNQRCTHCHVSAAPERIESMSWPIMELCLKAAKGVKCKLADLTGGAPELNPNFRRFVKTLRENGIAVQVRTNLTVMTEPEMETIPEWLRDHEVQLVASLPCYLEENVREQRGKKIYEKSIEIIKRLNALGYGIQPNLPLNLVYNPGGPFLPPDQSRLEADYRRELGKRFGIAFTGLLTITNMPIGRFLEKLRHRNQEYEYLRILRESFNPHTIPGLMCRHQISVGWDGSLFDCDFNMALRRPVDHGAPHHIKFFESSRLMKRRIVTGNYCYGCAAGCGSSCGGALV